MRSFKLHFFFIFLFSTITQTIYADRLKDMVSFAGIRSNQLMGYGIVVGLDGTGDSSLALTLQSMQSTISQFGMNVDAGSLSGKKLSCCHDNCRLRSIYKSRSKNWRDSIIYGKS